MKNKIASRVAAVELSGVNQNDLEIEVKENTIRTRLPRR